MSFWVTQHIQFWNTNHICLPRINYENTPFVMRPELICSHTERLIAHEMKRNMNTEYCNKKTKINHTWWHPHVWNLDAFGKTSLCRHPLGEWFSELHLHEEMLQAVPWEISKTLCFQKLNKKYKKMHSKNHRMVRKRGANRSMALSQTGSAFARPFTSFLVLVSKSPFMNDIVAFLQFSSYDLCLPRN